MSIGPNQYQCAMCKEVFNKAWADEEAAQEYAQNFPGLKVEEADFVCDDCFQRMHPEKYPERIETAIADHLKARLTKQYDDDHEDTDDAQIGKTLNRRAVIAAKKNPSRTGRMKTMKGTRISNIVAANARKRGLLMGLILRKPK